MRWHLLKRSRLIDALKERVDSAYSARFLKRALESNACRVNGQVERFASAQLEAGDLIELSALDKRKRVPLVFETLFENDDLLILNKPVRSICADAFFQKALKRRVFLAHRLDRDTTGALLFGKNLLAAKQLQELFEKKQVHKEYLALIDSVPKQKRGSIHNFLMKKRQFEGQTIWGVSRSGKGLYAETDWEIERVFCDCALLRCFPKTGRMHQIRVHLAEMGHPILTDRQYASRYRSSIVAPRPLLHASRLSFVWKGGEISVEAPLPEDFKTLLPEAVSRFEHATCVSACPIKKAGQLPESSS